MTNRRSGPRVPRIKATPGRESVHVIDYRGPVVVGMSDAHVIRCTCGWLSLGVADEQAASLHDSHVRQMITARRIEHLADVIPFPGNNAEPR